MSYEFKLPDIGEGMAEGEIYNTITHGKNLMGRYGDKLTPADRWAVIAYVRALQTAAQGTVNDVPPANRSERRWASAPRRTSSPRSAWT